MDEFSVISAKADSTGNDETGRGAIPWLCNAGVKRPEASVANKPSNPEERGWPAQAHPLLNDQHGTTAIEYELMLALLSPVMLGVLNSLGFINWFDVRLPETRTSGRHWPPGPGATA